MIARLLLLVLLPFCLAAADDPLPQAETPSSTTSVPAVKEKSKKKKPARPKETLRHPAPTIDLLASFSMFGPITYDQLGHYDKTGTAKRDPQLRSYYLGLRTQKPLSFGGYYIKGFTRLFQSIANSDSGTYSNNDVGMIRDTEISSQSFGIGFGWDFRSRLRPITWLPYFGLAIEKNVVTVKGRYFSEADSIDDQINLKSELNGIYAETGVSYRFLMGTFEPDIVLSTFIPIKASVRDNADNSSEDDITGHLYHGMRFGMALGAAVVFWTK